MIAEELLAGLPFRIAGALRQDADAPPDLGRPGVGVAGDLEAPPRGGKNRGQNADCRRLAGPVRTEDAEDLAAYRSRAKEPNLDLEKVLRDLRRRGKL